MDSLKSVVTSVGLVGATCLGLAGGALLLIEGADAVDVPRLTGRPVDEAIDELADLQLDVKRDDVIASNAGTIDEVIEQFPDRGVGVRRGDVVELVVAVRPAPRTNGRIAGSWRDIDLELNSVGQCGNAERTDSGIRISPANCDAPHDYQVAGLPTIRVSSNASSDTIDGEVRTECRDAFEDFVGAPAGGSNLALSLLVPPDAEVRAGDEKATCVISHRDRLKVIGNAEGTLW